MLFAGDGEVDEVKFALAPDVGGREEVGLESAEGVAAGDDCCVSTRLIAAIESTTF